MTLRELREELNNIDNEYLDQPLEFYFQPKSKNLDLQFYNDDTGDIYFYSNEFEDHELC